MSVLSDGDLRRAIAAGEIGVDPFNDEDIQPASIDLHLDKSFRVFRNNRYGFIDPSVDQPGLTELEVVSGAEPFMLHPSEFVLGQTLERISVGSSLLGRLDGKSSLGRLGLLIHSTAGYVDPGRVGNRTLELGNVEIGRAHV